MRHRLIYGDLNFSIGLQNYKTFGKTAKTHWFSVVGSLIVCNLLSNICHTARVIHFSPCPILLLRSQTHWLKNLNKIPLLKKGWHALGKTTKQKSCSFGIAQILRVRLNKVPIMTMIVEIIIMIVLIVILMIKWKKHNNFTFF